MGKFKLDIVVRIRNWFFTYLNTKIVRDAASTQTSLVVRNSSIQAAYGSTNHEDKYKLKFVKS